MYRETTLGIQVEVEPTYLPDESDPGESRFLFAYSVKITNVGDVPAQLLRRNWIITNGRGEVRQVDGAGVIGETPRLQPGETFGYSSFCPLDTPTGNMRGSYGMVDDSGIEFAARVPLFFFRDLRTLN